MNNKNPPKGPKSGHDRWKVLDTRQRQQEYWALGLPRPAWAGGERESRAAAALTVRDGRAGVQLQVLHVLAAQLRVELLQRTVPLPECQFQAVDSLHVLLHERRLQHSSRQRGQMTRMCLDKRGDHDDSKFQILLLA